MHRLAVLRTVLLLAVVGVSQSSPAMAAANIQCTMKFTMKGWSAFYKTADGTGIIKCNNGRLLKVSLSARGGGLTVGKSSIADGQGTFSAITDMGQLFGTYVAAEAHAGAVKPAGAQVMTKGGVSVALSGKDRGIDLGVVLGALTISL